MSKPFRFSVQAASPESAEGWREQARRIEALGYSSLVMPDHYVGTPLAVMPALAFAAEATTTLRIGMLVLGNDYKHPAVTAKEAATLDVLSGGRLEFGLGAGWMRADYDALGLPYDSAGVRIDRLAEAIEVIKGAWAPGPFSFSGDHYEIRDYDAVPKPVQQPHPPILLGGGGRKMLRLAGRVADIVGINPNLRAGEITADAARDSREDLVLEKIGWVREGAGDRFDDIELQVRYQLTAITDDARGLAEQLAPLFDITADEALASSVVLAGTVDEICDTLVRRREEWGASYDRGGRRRVRRVRARGRPPRRHLTRQSAWTPSFRHPSASRCPRHWATTRARSAWRDCGSRTLGLAPAAEVGVHELRIVQHGVGVAGDHLATEIEGHDAVRHCGDEREVVLDHEQARAGELADLEEQRGERLGLALRDAGRRLVEQDDAWAHADVAGEIDQPAGAGRQIRHELVAEVAEPRDLDELVGAGCRPVVPRVARWGGAATPAIGSHSASSRSSATQSVWNAVRSPNRRASWNDRPSPSRARCWGRSRVMSTPSSMTRPAFGHQEARHDVEQRGLARTVRARSAPRISPSCSSTLTSSSAVRPPNRFVIAVAASTTDGRRPAARPCRARARRSSRTRASSTPVAVDMPSRKIERRMSGRS